MTTAQKKALAIFAAILLVCAAVGFALGCVVGANADAPVYNGTATAVAPYSTDGLDALINCLSAEAGLGVLRASNSIPQIVAVYSVDAGNGQHYYYTLVSNSAAHRISDIVGGVSTPVSSFRTPVTGTYRYAWNAANSGGWVYDTVIAASTVINCSSLVAYRTPTTPLLSKSTPQLSGTNGAPAVATSWVNAWNVKVSGLPSTGGYTQEQYDAYGSAQYSAGRTQGRLDVTSEPNDYQLFTESQYNAYGTTRYNAGKIAGVTQGRNDVLNNPEDYQLFTESQFNTYGTQRYDAGRTQGRNDVIDAPNDYDLYTQEQYDANAGGETVIVEKVDLFELVAGFPLAVKSIFTTGFAIEFGGIMLGGLFLTIIIALVVVWLWKKVK